MLSVEIVFATFYCPIIKRGEKRRKRNGMENEKIAILNRKQKRTDKIPYESVFDCETFEIN